MDFSDTLKGLSVALVVTAIVGAGSLMALPGFGRWVVDRVASFFTDQEHDDVNDEIADDEAGENDDDAACEFSGHTYDNDGECCYCGAVESEEERD